MTAYNPIETLHRLETAGFQRSQSEALATELHHATTSLVTKDELSQALDAQTNKLTVRVGAMFVAAVPLVLALAKLF